MAFDPDAYLKGEKQSDTPAFDPDVYLGGDLPREEMAVAEAVETSIQAALPQEMPQAAQPEQADIGQQIREIPGGNEVLELISGFNRGIAKIADFVGTDTVNAALRLAGTDVQLPRLSEEIPGITGGYVEPGLTRDILGAAGETAAGGAVGGLALRGAAATLPAATTGEGVLAGAVRQLGQTTPGIEAGLGAVSGAGMEVGEEVGGTPGAIVGGIAAPLGAAAATRSLLSAAGVSDDVVRSIQKPAATTRPKEPPAKAKIAQMLKAQDPNIETARYKLPGVEDTPTDKIRRKLNIGGPEVVKDRVAIDAINQGFDEGVIAAVKASGIKDKQKMLSMVDIMQKGKKNKLFAQTNRPSDVAGNSLMERVRVIMKANRDAGGALDGVAKELRGQAVDFNPAVTRFIDDLEDMGVYIGDDLTPNFIGSDIEGLTAPENAIKQIIKRMSTGNTVDGYDVHRLKKYIDENVTYGKNAEGLAGKTETVLKRLRSNLDSILDQNFPEYDRMNTAYAETRGILDSLQDVAGRKMNLSGPNAEKATGTLLRRLMSNAQSRVNLLDAVNQIDAGAKKYVKFSAERPDPTALPDLRPKDIEKFDDDIMAQILFVDELDAVFGPVARTSFQGQVEQGVKAAAKGTTKSGAIDLAIDLGAKAAERVRGINEDSAFEAIRTLLRR